MAIKGKDLSYGKQYVFLFVRCEIETTQKLKSPLFCADFEHNKPAMVIQIDTKDRSPVQRG